jgi:endonuclease/exonuclease/phosphatase family metal-dependent hydrolase
MRLPSGHIVRLMCVHAPPPKPWNPTGAARWRGELALLPGPGELRRPGEPVAPGSRPASRPVAVAAGDFNATLDHWQLRSVLRRGYVDAARQAGHGLTPTWGPRPSRPPGLLALDHVLVDPRCAVLATSARRLAGSDHHALYAEIRLPAEP